MRAIRPTIRFKHLLIAIVLIAMVLPGCSSLSSRTQGDSGSAVSGQSNGPAPIYYDFGDVLIPSEMKVDRAHSFVFKTPGLTAGVLSLKGSVDMESLITFFQVNMAKDNWQLISSFKSPQTVLLFQKQNRWCIIDIHESEFSTYARVYVAPTIGETATGGLMK